MATQVLNLKNAIAATSKWAAENQSGGNYNIVGTFGDILRNEDLKGAEMFENKNRTGIYFTIGGKMVFGVRFTENFMKYRESVEREGGEVSLYQLCQLGVQLVNKTREGEPLVNDAGEPVELYFLSAPQTERKLVSVGAVLEAADKAEKVAPKLTAAEAFGLFKKVGA